MSRSLTTAQIIEQGDYLKSDFDPNSLTISQLLGLFGYHGITYPAPSNKPKLCTIFNDEIKPRAEQYKQERLSRQNSQASDDGITDGMTGRPLNEERKVRSVCTNKVIFMPMILCSVLHEQRLVGLLLLRRITMSLSLNPASRNP